MEQLGDGRCFTMLVVGRVVNKQFLRLGRTSPEQMRGRDLQAMTAGKIARVCPSDDLKPALQADQEETEALPGFSGNSLQQGSGASAAGYAVDHLRNGEDADPQWATKLVRRVRTEDAMRASPH